MPTIDQVTEKVEVIDRELRAMVNGMSTPEAVKQIAIYQVAASNRQAFMMEALVRQLVNMQSTIGGIVDVILEIERSIKRSERYVK